MIKTIHATEVTPFIGRQQTGSSAPIKQIARPGSSLGALFNPAG
ncbi:MAG: hypothetical protein ABJD68_10675 [Nakamurella sp.]